MRRGNHYASALLPVGSVLLAFLIGGIIIIGEGKNPFLAYLYLLKGALGTEVAIGETIAKMTPLIFTGLAATFAYRCGMFNLGGEGQFIMGAIAACCVANYFPGQPGFFHRFLAMAAGMLAGALWGAIPGLLRARSGVNEMISSILLNYIATLFMEYLFSGPMKEANIPQTAAVPEGMRLTNFFFDTRAHTGVFMALLAALLVWYFLFRTYEGYSLRAVGLNPPAAFVNGFSVSRMMVLSFVVSGAIAGFGGAVELMGISYRLQSGFASGFGFDGVSIALIGQLHPLGVLLTSFLFAALKCGTNTMQIMTGIPTSIVDIIQAIIIIFAVAASALIHLPRLQQVLQRFQKKETENE